MKIKLLVVILIAFCLSNCNTDKHDEIVLVIGKYKLTKPELELKRKKDKYKFLNEQALKEKLIEEGRIIAFALDNRYDTLATLKKLFEYASRSYASEVDGFVWNKKVKAKLELTDNYIKSIYLNRSQEYLLDVVLFSDKSSLDKYYKSSDNFNVIKAKARSKPEAKVFNASVKFPYYPLSYYTDSINNLKVGQIIGPLETERGYLVAHVLSAKPIVKNTYKQEKANIRQEVLFGLKQKYLWENQKRITKDADPEIYNNAIQELATNFDEQKKNWPGVKPNLLIMKYNFGGKRISYLLSDLREFITNQPVFFGSLTTPDGVKKILLNIIIEQYLFAEAKMMNMEVYPEYQQFSKDNKETIFIEHYKRNYVYPKLSVNGKEMEDYYHKNIQNFRSFESASISLFKFKDMQSAFQGRPVLEREARGIASTVSSNSSNGNILPKAVEIQVKMSELNNDPQILGAILRLGPSQISAPLKLNKQVVIVKVTGKQGLATIPFIYVKGDIQRLIYFQKEKQITTRLEEGLKEKYPVEKDELKEAISEIK